jgi:hypothetical protein
MRKRRRRNVSPERVHWYRHYGGQIIVDVHLRRAAGEVVDDVEMERLLEQSWQAYQARPSADVIDMFEWMKTNMEWLRARRAARSNGDMLCSG